MRKTRKQESRSQGIKYIYKRTGGRGTVGRTDENRVDNGFAVDGTDIPRIHTMYHSVWLRFIPIRLATDKYPASVGYLFRGDYRVVVAHDSVREQGYDNDRVTPDGVIFVAVFVMVL